MTESSSSKVVFVYCFFGIFSLIEDLLSCFSLMWLFTNLLSSLCTDLSFYFLVDLKLLLVKFTDLFQLFYRSLNAPEFAPNLLILDEVSLEVESCLELYNYGSLL
jgi:hypothetical protein